MELKLEGWRRNYNSYYIQSHKEGLRIERLKTVVVLIIRVNTLAWAELSACLSFSMKQQ